MLWEKQGTYFITWYVNTNQGKNLGTQKQFYTYIKIKHALREWRNSNASGHGYEKT